MHWIIRQRRSEVCLKRLPRALASGLLRLAPNSEGLWLPRFDGHVLGTQSIQICCKSRDYSKPEAKPLIEARSGRSVLLSVVSGHEMPFALGYIDFYLCTGVKLKKIGFYAVAKDHSTFGHERFYL